MLDIRAARVGRLRPNNNAGWHFHFWYFFFSPGPAFALGMLSKCPGPSNFGTFQGAANLENPS